MHGHAFRLELPESITTSAVFASPHSGRDYPPAFLSRSILDAHAVRSSEDAFMDWLVADAPACGAPLLLAMAPRAYVDLNRSSDELDPALIEGLRRSMPNPRISSGLGVIPRVVSNGRAIYRGKLTLAEAEERLQKVWHPYHAALQGLLQDQINRFGEAILFDMHSMPHDAIASYGQRGRAIPEVVIGDRFGASAAGWIVDAVERVFAESGLRTARNAPFAGAFVTQHYGRPSKRQHVVQIEIDRALYMNEGTLELRPAFAAVQRTMGRIVAALAEIGRRESRLAAAE
ncbi:N-formylglutamate amidohydrolase [Plastorhodobacter daqingensis]|uniref:N-formylglutamate amidohydrolase n=1 Tax=Plastorhodobacter daqingensis TaxID=1387281 RepID=A0ABW2UP54_9RHOB